MDEPESNVVTLHSDRSRQIRDAAESLRLLKAFMMLSAARRSEIVDALESEALSQGPADPR